jgi:hypothetical protein
MALIGSEKVNPRHLREKFTGWDGKRVNVGLTTDHYICGVWERIDDDNNVVFKIANKQLAIPIAHIDTVSDAPPWQADFYK